MKNNLLFLTLLLSLLVLSCDSNMELVKGEWRVSNKYYKANYLIKSEKNNVVGQVLYYNDGTTHYTYEGGKPHYIFKNLLHQDSIYVDGVSGATTSNKTATLSIKIINPNKIEVKKSVLNQKVTEYWYKQK